MDAVVSPASMGLEGTFPAFGVAAGVGVCFTAIFLLTALGDVAGGASSPHPETPQMRRLTKKLSKLVDSLFIVRCHFLLLFAERPFF